MVVGLGFDDTSEDKLCSFVDTEDAYGPDSMLVKMLYDPQRFLIVK